MSSYTSRVLLMKDLLAMQTARLLPSLVMLLVVESSLRS